MSLMNRLLEDFVDLVLGRGVDLVCFFYFREKVLKCSHDGVLSWNFFHSGLLIRVYTSVIDRQSVVYLELR